MLLSTVSTTARSALPAQAGFGLRAPHYRAVIDQKPAVGFLEIHPENFFDSPSDRAALDALRADYLLSFHAVSLSLGSTTPPRPEHLQRLRDLIKRYQPASISDHASWSRTGNAHLNDLLPLPYNEESLATVVDNVNRVQDYFGQTLLIENPSTYLEWQGSTMTEAYFLKQLCQQTGCRLIVDVNNLYVNAHNHGSNPAAFLQQIPPALVGEIHLSGHTQRQFAAGSLLIDTHNRPVSDPVWQLYETALNHYGAVATLIEWDADLPDLDVLLAHVTQAESLLQQKRLVHAA